MKAFKNTFLKPFDADDLQDSVCSSFGELKDLKVLQTVIRVYLTCDQV